MLQENLTDQNQLNFFTLVLKQIINPKHALRALSEQIDWLKLEMAFAKKYNNDQGRPAKKLSNYQKTRNRNKFRTRIGIEPVIGHLKSDFRLSRNFLAGIDGDKHNLMMAVATFNFRKWIVKHQALVKNWLYSLNTFGRLLGLKQFNFTLN